MQMHDQINATESMLLSSSDALSHHSIRTVTPMSHTNVPDCDDVDARYVRRGKYEMMNVFEGRRRRRRRRRENIR